MNASHSDALVIFGATGDLVAKKIFPALDAMVGDGALFAGQHGVEAAWAVVQPVLGCATPLHGYEPGTWGPPEAEEPTTGVCECGSPVWLLPHAKAGVSN